MEIDSIAMAQSNAIREVNANVLDKSLAQKDEQTEMTVNHDSKEQHLKPEDPSVGKQIDLFA